jgi:pimeloyl-ACP methyl ester carboxylesterase
MNRGVRILLLSAVSAAVAAGVASSAYQQRCDARDRRRFPPPGRLVDIGGRRLHLVTEGDGSPAVVIIPALSSSVAQWFRVQRGAANAARTTVCVYDRADIGWSDPPRRRMAFDAMADDLHALIKGAGIETPCIIAGHSIGGIIARRFQARYPGDVAALLLIDSSHEEQARRFPWRTGAWPNLKIAMRAQAKILGAWRLAADLGLLHRVDEGAAWEASLPVDVPAVRSFNLSTRERRVTVWELLLLTLPRGRPAELGSLPLTVLTVANRSWSGYPTWSRLQAELAALSTDSVHMTAVSGGHNVHLDEPDLVIRVFSDVVARFRACSGHGA